MSKFRILLILLIIAFFTVSCDKTMVYDQFLTLENDTWNWGQSLDFQFEVEDTTSFHRILIQVRHTTDYPLSNLYMFAHVTGPSGQAMNDTIQFLLAENSGKWIGKGIGNLREIAYLYRRSTRFPEPGAYVITLEQAMRLEEIPVSEVGVRVELNQP